MHRPLARSARTLLAAAAILFTLTGCRSTPNLRVETRLNDPASLTGSLPANPLAWRVVTSWIDHPDSTMSTLFGNDTAIDYARSSAQQKYPAGSVLALVTWEQQEDPRWFGGNIPKAPKSVEFVTVTAGTGSDLAYSYQSFAGTPLKQVTTATGLAPDSRAAFIVGQRAAVMPD